MIMLNDKVYPRCPRALYMDSLPARFFVRTYFDCAAKGIYPCPGSIIEQTAFTSELFEFLDRCVSDAKLKAAKRQPQNPPV